MVPFPIAQGFIPSWKSAEIDVGGRRVLGMKSASWDETCEGEVEYGNGPLPIGVTIGEYLATSEIEQLLSEYVALLQRLGNGYRAKTFNYAIQFNEPGVDLVSVEFRNVRIASNAVQGSGKGGTTVKYKVQIIEPIRWNGLTMIERFNAGGGAGFSVGGAISATAGGFASFGAGASAPL